MNGISQGSTDPSRQLTNATENSLLAPRGLSVQPLPPLGADVIVGDLLSTVWSVRQQASLCSVEEVEIPHMLKW